MTSTHPSVLTEDLFADILTAASTDQRFLRYDKDIRWSERKVESVLTEDIVHRPGETLIPTLSRRGAGMIRVHLYGIESDSVPAASELAQKLAATQGAAKARVIRFLGPEVPKGRGTRIQLKDFSKAPCPAPEGSVNPLSERPEQERATFADFADFADEMAADGVTFLYGQMRAGKVGTVLTVGLDGKVAGATGPMEIRPDAIGTRQLMPQYFGVLPKQRGAGLGRLLWRAAMHGGQAHGAAHRLLQTKVGGPSDRLCRSEGLASLGFVYVQAAA
jgi:hypothetical protein